MMAYVMRRVLYAIPIALGVSIVCFALVYLAPGDPLQTLLPEDASAETIDIVKKAYGLDRPLAMQYLIWLGRAISGDLGISIATGRQVSGEIFKALSNTIILSVGAIVLSFSLAFGLGITAGYLHGRWADRLVTGFAVVGVSVPNYWF